MSMRRNLVIAVSVLFLAGCVTVAVNGGRELSAIDLSVILNAVPGVTPATTLSLPDAAYVALPKSMMWELYSRVPASVAYKDGVWDCDKYAKWSAINVDLEWAKMGGRMPIAHGVILGILPEDGNQDARGPHALNWFVDNEGKFWLRGAQEKAIFTQWSVDKIKSVTEIMTG